MKPILFVHGYSSETAHDIQHLYGTLPADLSAAFGSEAVCELDLSQWISLCDGITLDDVSFGFQRALQHHFPHLLRSGFHAIVHSTGSLVIRNWLRLFSAKPSPLQNLVHLAGAHFGSGLAHIGRGQLARWGRQLSGNGCGIKLLKELEFGAWKTLDLQLSFLQSGCDPVADYQVYESCIIGSQTLPHFTLLPIRYVKEDSADGTVRTSAGNLNFQYVKIMPTDRASLLTVSELQSQLTLVSSDPEPPHYQLEVAVYDEQCCAIPFAVVGETTHFGGDTGIVSGERNRKQVLPLIAQALRAEGMQDYTLLKQEFDKRHTTTFTRVGRLKPTAQRWSKHRQYEAHAQLIFRLRDQHGEPVDAFDIHFSSRSIGSRFALESLIEDKHCSRAHAGTIVFYLRTQRFIRESCSWRECLEHIAPVVLEITACEPDSSEIHYLPARLRLSASTLRRMIRSFRSTVIDVTLLRLPNSAVFKLAEYA